MPSWGDGFSWAATSTTRMIRCWRRRCARPRRSLGLVGLIPSGDGVFDVDVHTIPFHAAKNEPEHLHFDVRYLIVAADRAFTISDESNDLRWFDLDEAALVAGDDSLRRMIRKVRSGLA